MRSCADAVIRLLAVVAVIAVVGAIAGAQTTDPAVLYKEALAREALLRKDLEAHRPPQSAARMLDRIRVVIGAYEDLARLFPTSGYSDNALWQGARLAADLYYRFGEPGDRETALRMLRGLVAGFPTSSLVKQVAPHIAKLEAQRPPPAPSAPALLRAIRRENLPGTLRVILELEREVPFSEQRIEGPSRVFVDLQHTRPVEMLKDATIPFPDPVVRQVRIGRHVDARTRVVFDLGGDAAHSVYALYNPYRVVVDFEQRPSNAVAAAPAPSAEPAAAPLPPSANRTGGFSLSRQLGLGVTRVVIDPGHGGHDPGAQGPGLTEASLVLDVALRLEKLLKKANVDVVLTRRDNRFVSLDERTSIANTSEADLFLSIHANASDLPSARGVETYYLNFAQDKEGEAIAARENAGSDRSMRDLQGIVQAIALDNKRDESRDFATILQSSLYQRLRRANRSIRNLGVKQAPFMVLIGATMPSILTEIAFMSHRQEGALLKTERYREQIAEALQAGIVRYQDSLKRATPAEVPPRAGRNGAIAGTQ